MPQNGYNGCGNELDGIGTLSSNAEIKNSKSMHKANEMP